MATLASQTIASTYDQILALPSGGGSGATLVALTDGDAGTTFCLQLSTTKALIQGSGSKLFFSDEGGEYISGNNTALTLNSGEDINLTCATGDVNIPVNIGLRFGDGNQHIETDNTDLTITSDVSINLSAPQVDLLVDTNFVTTGGVNGMSIDGTTFSVDGGNNRVGIGTASPDSILDVETVAGTTVLIQTTAQTDTNYSRIQCKSVQASTSYTVYSEIGNYQHSATQTDGPVGYIRLMPADRAISAYLWVENDDTLKSSSTIGHIGTTSGVEFGAAVTSDERLKDIDSSPFPYGLSDINKLTPIKFQFNNKKNKVDKLGFGAQTVRDIISEPVKDTDICIDGYSWKYDEDGKETEQVANSDDKEGKLTLEYNQLIPVLVKAVQELSAKVEVLESA